jgi:hypothetical protein
MLSRPDHSDFQVVVPPQLGSAVLVPSAINRKPQITPKLRWPKGEYQKPNPKTNFFLLRNCDKGGTMNASKIAAVNRCDVSGILET